MIKPEDLKKHFKSPFNKAIIICLLFLTGSYICFSQGKEANIWYFGVAAGVDFNQGSPPVALTNSQMYIISGNTAGSATISDSTGSLLFYSDGVKIWNKDHEIMQNGGAMGSNSTQGAMIVPKPGSNHIYYFFNFYIAQISYFQYSIIDMNLDNGRGGWWKIKKELYY